MEHNNYNGNRNGTKQKKQKKTNRTRRTQIEREEGKNHGTTRTNTISFMYVWIRFQMPLILYMYNIAHFPFFLCVCSPLRYYAFELFQSCFLLSWFGRRWNGLAHVYDLAFVCVCLCRRVSNTSPHSFGPTTPTPTSFLRLISFIRTSKLHAHENSSELLFQQLNSLFLLNFISLLRTWWATDMNPAAKNKQQQSD